MKAVAQGVLSGLPGGERLNVIFQRHVTRTLGLSDAFFSRKVGQVARHVEAYRRLTDESRRPFAVLELGTGWQPLVPVGLFLCGASEVVTVDIRPLLDDERVRATLAAYCRAADSGHLGELLPGYDQDRCARLHEALEMRACSPAVRLAALGIRVVAGDVRAASLPGSSLDLIVSNNTLEHIPPPALGEILTEFARLLHPAGLMSHSIDLSDHYSHFDRRLSPYNFLRFSESSWRWYNNRLAYQNRCRFSDYRRMLLEAGFEVLEERTSAPRAELLREVPLWPGFQAYETADLQVTGGWLAARLACGAGEAAVGR